MLFKINVTQHKNVFYNDLLQNDNFFANFAHKSMDFEHQISEGTQFGAYIWQQKKCFQDFQSSQQLYSDTRDQCRSKWRQD